MLVPIGFIVAAKSRWEPLAGYLFIITHVSDYFTRLHSISVSQYVHPTAKKVSSNNTENGMVSKSKIDEEKMNPYYF